MSPVKLATGERTISLSHLILDTFLDTTHGSHLLRPSPDLPHQPSPRCEALDEEIRDVNIRIYTIAKDPLGKTLMSGTVDYLGPQRNVLTDLAATFRESAMVKVLTYLPHDNIFPGNIVHFDKIRLREVRETSLWLANDPRSKGQTPGTKEYNERAYALLKSMATGQPLPPGLE